MKKISILLVLFLVYSLPLAFAADEANQAANDSSKIIRLEVIIPDEVMLGLAYTSLFKLTNLNHTKGVDRFVNVTVFYNVSRDAAVIQESNFSKLVNAFTSTNTGYFFVGELGDYILCGSSEISNSTCKNFTVINPLEIGCFASLNLSVNKVMFGNNERVEIKNNLQVNSSKKGDFPFIIEYWVEDLFGEVVKEKINTSNENEKSFTPDIEERDAVFIVKNRLSYVGCNNSNTKISNEALFVVKNQDYKEEVDAPQAAVKKTSKENYISSFYTRTKKYHPEINLYANIKVNGRATLFLKGESSQYWKPIESSQKLTFKVKANEGSNFYELKLYIDEEEVDSKSLIVELEPSADSEKPKPNITAVVNVTRPVPVQKSEAVKGNVSVAVNSTRNDSGLITENKTHSPTQATASVVYEGSRSKAGSYAPYIAMASICLAAAAALLLRHQ